jgi:hypothetical protein
MPTWNGKFENHQHSRNNFFDNLGSAAILQTLGVKYELQCTLRHYDLVIGECRLTDLLQNGQGQADSLTGLARGMH